MTDGPRALAAALREQAGWCERLGSPFHHFLLLCIADDVEACGICWKILEPRGVFTSDPPQFEVAATVAERRGCDLNPMDPLSEEGRLALQSFLWPDQLDRFERLDRAIEVARRVPAAIDRAALSEPRRSRAHN
jgi:hypothetical protein